MPQRTELPYLCPVLIVLTICMKGIPPAKQEEYIDKIRHSMQQTNSQSLGYAGHIETWYIPTKTAATKVEVFNIGNGEKTQLAKITKKIEAKLEEFFSKT